MLSSFGIQPVPTIADNPQANTLIKRNSPYYDKKLQTTTFKGEDWR